MENKIFNLPFIRGISAVVPKKRVNLAELDFDKESLINIMKLSGIHEVRVSAENETVSDYCIRAAKYLFEELNFDKSQIDGIVFSTPSHDYIQPGSGYVVHRYFNLSNDCMVVDLLKTCNGWVFGLFQAYLMIQSGYCKNVLLCAGDTPSKFVNPKDKSMMMVSGDAGSATIISAGEKNYKTAFTFYNDGKGINSLWIPAGGTRTRIKVGVTDVEETDEQGNVHSAENLYMNGLDVMCFAMNSSKYTVNKVLKLMDLSKEDIDLFLFHQANKFMVNTLGKRLRLPPEKVPFQIDGYGNSGNATIPLTLCAENQQKTLNVDKVVCCAFGAGFDSSAAVLTLKDTYFCNLHEFNF